MDTLKGKGPFVVFAPKDAAFAKIPMDQFKALMANKAKLAILLNYHVVPGEVMSINFNNGMALKTVQGEDLTITITNAGIMVENANIVQADIECSNGVIHESWHSADP